MLHSCNLIKKRLQNRCFPVNFAKFFRINFSQNTPWRQLLVTVEHSLNRDHLFSTYTKFSGKTNISDSPILTCTCVCVSGGEKHYVKSVHVRSCSGPHFRVFGLNTERYFVSFRMQSECGKMQTKITPNTYTFLAVKS